jgi:hypothetical protein
MKSARGFIFGCAIAVWAASAHAGSVNDRSKWTSLDKIRNAFNNPTSPGATVHTPTVPVDGATFKTHDVPMRGLNSAPAPRMHETGVVDSKQVDIKRRDISVRDAGVRTTAMTNFTGKRAPVSDRVYADAARVQAVNAAPISSRRIHVGSPEGLEELRKQLNRTP